MAEKSTPVAELLFRTADATPISTDEATVKSWADARERLAEAPKYWLATGRTTGRPHVMPVLAVVLDDMLYVSTRPNSHKGRNLAHNAQCVVTVSTETIDLVVECAASELVDDTALRRAADAFDAKYGWRLTVRDGHAYDDSLAGSPHYGLYELTPELAFGFGADGMTATRWRF